MRFGIFFELSVPRPFSAEGEQAVFESALEQARLADQLGFETAWAGQGGLRASEGSGVVTAGQVAKQLATAMTTRD